MKKKILEEIERRIKFQEQNNRHWKGTTGNDSIVSVSIISELKRIKQFIVRLK